MFKIYVQNNYFFIQDNNSLYEGLKKEVRVNVKNITDADPIISFSNVKGWNDTKEIKFSQIVDENDAPFADIQAFVDFYTANTGNFNTPQAGGNFIPLTGTEEGSPVTGDIKVNSVRIFTEKSGDTFELNFQENFIGYKVSVGNYGISFDPNAEGVTKVIDEVNNIGLLGEADFSETLPENKNIYAQRSYVDQKVADSRPYKVYTALLTQSGTDAPVATVLENTLGGDIVWTRNNSGDYTGTLLGAFPIDKTTIQIIANSGQGYTTANGVNDIDSISLVMADDADTLGDNLLYKTPIEIRVYN